MAHNPNLNVPAPADPDEAIRADYAVWLAAKNAFHALDGGTDAEHAPYYLAIVEAEAAVLRHRPVTAQGLAIQHAVFTTWGEFEASRSKTFDFQAHIFALADVEPDNWTKENPPETHF